MNNAKSRARDIEEKVLAAIESGEFTPDFGYLLLDARLGPCGCLLACAAFVEGAEPTDHGTGSYELREFLTSKGVTMSELEGHQMEAGYEGRVVHRPPDGFTEQDVERGPFFEMGKRLHRFNPDPSTRYE